MNRQQFCEKLGIEDSNKTLDGILIDLLERLRTFEASKEYVSRFLVTNWSDKAALSKILEIFNTQIEYTVPVEYRSHIRWAVNKYKPEGSVMWTYNPK